MRTLNLRALYTHRFARNINNIDLQMTTIFSIVKSALAGLYLDHINNAEANVLETGSDDDIRTGVSE